MPWNQVFPLGTDLVSNAPPLFQQNWAFINTNLNTDHYFNVGAPNEGHHKFSQYVSQGAANPVLAVDGVIYVRTNFSAGLQQPFFRSAATTQQIPLTFNPVANTGGPAVNFPLFNVTLPNPSYGFFTISQIGGSANLASGCFSWDGAAVTVSQLSARGAVTGVGASGTFITLSQTIVGAASWQLCCININP